MARRHVWRDINHELTDHSNTAVETSHTIASINLPSPRAAHSCDVIGNRLILFAGWIGKEGLNDLFVYDIPTQRWSRIFITEDSPEARHDHTTAIVGVKLYMHGGLNGSKWFDDLHILNLESVADLNSLDLHLSDITLKWMTPEISGQLPSARCRHTLTHINDKLYMFGGWNGKEYFNDIEILDLATLSWIRPTITGIPPQSRQGHTVTAVDTLLYLFGGECKAVHLSDIHVFDTVTLSWMQTEFTGASPPGLRGHTSNLVGRKLFIFGGTTGKTHSSDLYILDVVDRKWTHSQKSEAALTGRDNHSACLVNANEVYIFGGFDGKKCLNDMHIALVEVDYLIGPAVQLLISNIQRHMLEKAEFADVTLVVGGVDYPCHRSMLAAQCLYFRKMFQSDLREAQQNRITLEGLSSTAFEAMREYLYTGKMSHTDVDIVREVMGMADVFTNQILKSICEVKLRYLITDANVISLYIDANKCQALTLEKCCKSFIKKNKQRLNRNGSLDKLSHPSHYQLLFSLVKDESESDKEAGAQNGVSSLDGNVGQTPDW